MAFAPAALRHQAEQDVHAVAVLAHQWPGHSRLHPVAFPILPLAWIYSGSLA
ncbi:MAG TPA: hypothetical protein VFK06_00700 [Candidatus Angelobacter sp.]|nr:hypothetical protein [Candidatus Angelobacter sp.]